MDSLNQRGPWTISPKGEAAEKRILPSKFVLRVKRNAERSVRKYKARLVVIGSCQYPRDTVITYSPVFDFETVRLILEISKLEGAHVEQIDIKTACLLNTYINFFLHLTI